MGQDDCLFNWTFWGTVTGKVGFGGGGYRLWVSYKQEKSINLFEGLLKANVAQRISGTHEESDLVSLKPGVTSTLRWRAAPEETLLSVALGTLQLSSGTSIRAPYVDAIGKICVAVVLHQQGPAWSFFQIPDRMVHLTHWARSPSCTLAAKESGKHVSDFLCGKTWAHKMGNFLNAGGKK